MKIIKQMLKELKADIPALYQYLTLMLGVLGCIAFVFIWAAVGLQLEHNGFGPFASTFISLAVVSIIPAIGASILRAYRRAKITITQENTNTQTELRKVKNENN